MDAFTNIIVTDLTYLLPSLLGIALCAFWMRGYFTPYLRVRTSMGKKILVNESLEHRTMWHDAIVKGPNLEFGKEGNDRHPLRILFGFKKEYIYEMLNVKCIDFDAATNSFIPHNLTAKNLATIDKMRLDPRLTAEDVNEIYGNMTNSVEGFSQSNVESMLIDAKFKPGQMKDLIKYLVIGGLILAVICGISAYFSYNNGSVLTKGFYPDIQSMKATLETIKATCGPAIQQVVATH